MPDSTPTSVRRRASHVPLGRPMRMGARALRARTVRWGGSARRLARQAAPRARRAHTRVPAALYAPTAPPGSMTTTSALRRSVRRALLEHSPRARLQRVVHATLGNTRTLGWRRVLRVRRARATTTVTRRLRAKRVALANTRLLDRRHVERVRLGNSPPVQRAPIVLPVSTMTITTLGALVRTALLVRRRSRLLHHASTVKAADMRPRVQHRAPGVKLGRRIRTVTPRRNARHVGRGSTLRPA